jgi:hypothetical protein
VRITTEWAATVAGDEVAATITYTAPCCNTVYAISVQAPVKGEPTETELWCHRDGKGTPARVTLG